MTTSPAVNRRRWAARLLAAAAVAIVAMLGNATPAAAHATLLYTTPAAETAEPVSPPLIVLVFSEPVTITADAVVLETVSGLAVAVKDVAVQRTSTTVTARPAGQLAAGVHTVRWRVTGADGDPVEGRFWFGVGTPVTTPSTLDDSGTGTSWPQVWWRWILLAALTLAAGSVAGDRLVAHARRTNPALPEVEGWAGVASLVGTLAATAATVQYTAAAGGQLLATPAATVATVQAVAFAVAFTAVTVRRTGWTALALATIVVAEAMRAHPHTTIAGWVALLSIVHIAAAAVWAGTLLHVLRVAIVWREHRGAIWWLITTYARLAVWAFAAVAVTGTIAALVLAPLPGLWAPRYSALLATKVAMVTVAAGLAVWAAADSTAAQAQCCRLSARPAWRPPRLPRFSR